MQESLAEDKELQREKRGGTSESCLWKQRLSSHIMRNQVHQVVNVGHYYQHMVPQMHPSPLFDAQACAGLHFATTVY